MGLSEQHYRKYHPYIRWTPADDEKLVKVTLEHQGDLNKIYNEFRELRSKESIKNRQSKLRKKGMLSFRMKNVEDKERHMYTLAEAEGLMKRLDDYWKDRGYTSQRFWHEYQGEGKYIVKSNLVGGLPPEKRNIAVCEVRR